MFEALHEILTFFPNSFFGSLVIGAVCPFLGVFFILRRMAFLGVAVPQFAAAGMAFGFLILEPWYELVHHEHGDTEIAGHFTFFLACSLLFTFAALLLLVWLGRRGAGAPEGRIAVGYSLAAALTILCLAGSALGQSHIDVLLRGEILAIGFHELLAILAVFGLVFGVFCYYRRDFLLVAFDPDFAISLGKRTLAWDTLLYLLVGTAISVGVLTVGPLVIFGLLVIPPMAARQIAFNMTSFYLLASLIGLLSSFAGFLVSYLCDWPLGPTDVVTAFAFLFLIWLARRLVALLRPARA
jgi:ABC-type Mn2+/Zn2+ transport system permease subunit